MTRRKLLVQVLAVVAVYLLAVVAGIALRRRFPGKDNPVYGTYKDLVPFAIAIPAAWLGYSFQRRASYLQALRSVYTDIVRAVNAAVEYTRWDADRTVMVIFIAKQRMMSKQHLSCIRMTLSLKRVL